MTFSSLSVPALPVPEMKIEDHFSKQIYPYLVGIMASETTFDHWKVVLIVRKSEKKGPNFLGSMVRILKFTYKSDNLAKTESLLIFSSKNCLKAPCVLCWSITYLDSSLAHKRWLKTFWTWSFLPRWSIRWVNQGTVLSRSDWMTTLLGKLSFTF